MASYQIRWKASATKELRQLPRTAIARILSVVELLATDPRPHNTRKLSGTDYTFRLRVGDYRILYTVEDELLLIHVVRVGHRRDVYRD